MGIKIKNPKDREVIFQELSEMEEEEREIEEQEMLDAELYPADYFVSYSIDYCPECGDNLYIKGETCLVCGFPKHYLSYNDAADQGIFYWDWDF